MKEICQFISYCVKKNLKNLNNSDIEAKLLSICINDDFFGSTQKQVYDELVDMIYNSVRTSLDDIPLQQTSVPGANKTSWLNQLSVEDKQNLHLVHLQDPHTVDTEDDSTVPLNARISGFLFFYRILFDKTEIYPPIIRIILGYIFNLYE